jgi:hypothetical protein
MSEPTYGSGQYDPQQGYGQQGGYGGQPYGEQPPAQPPYPSGQQPAYGQQGGGYGYGGSTAYGQQPAGYSGAGYPSSGAPSMPSTTKQPQDKLALAATLLTIVGYVCAGAGVLGFILWLAANGDGISRFATALGTLVTGLGLGGLNYGLGTWLGERRSLSS